MYLLHNAPERLLGCGLLRVGQIANDVWQNIVDGIPLQTKIEYIIKVYLTLQLYMYCNNVKQVIFRLKIFVDVPLQCITPRAHKNAMY